MKHFIKYIFCQIFTIYFFVDYKKFFNYIEFDDGSE